MVWMPFSFSRFSVRAPMPGRSRSVSCLQRFGQNVQRQRHQAVGLLHVAGHLGQVAVGGQAHRAAQHRSDPLPDARLHLAAQLHGGQQRPFAAHQPAGHLVDGAARRSPAGSFPRPPRCGDGIRCKARGGLPPARCPGTSVWRRPPWFRSSRRRPWPRNWRQCRRLCRPSWAPRPPAGRAAPAAPPAPPKQSRSSDRRRASSGMPAPLSARCCGAHARRRLLEPLLRNR